ncbi:hypothetical protein EMGBD4_05270 [Verrucomicrobiota bacterium]|nr:hypothetical protein EMGBD4_05270 [Verrucomicrobiota bacterium]
MNPLLAAHKHYGTLLLVLVLLVILVALTKGPKPALQRIVAVLVDINLVVGLIAFFQTVRPISWFHPILALGAVGLLHADGQERGQGQGRPLLLDRPRPPGRCLGRQRFLGAGVVQAELRQAARHG